MRKSNCYAKYRTLFAVVTFILISPNLAFAELYNDFIEFNGDWVGTDSVSGIVGVDDFTLELTSAISVAALFFEDTITLEMTGSANPANYIVELDSLVLSDLDWNGTGTIASATATTDIADPRLLSVDVLFTDTTLSFAPTVADNAFSWFPGESVTIAITSQPVPEPNSVATFFATVLFFLFRRRKLNCRTQQPH